MSLTTKAFFIRAALRLRAGPFATAFGWSRVSPYSVLQPKRKKDTFRCPSFWVLFANDNDGIRTYFQPQAVGVGFLCTLCPSQNEKKDTFGLPTIKQVVYPKSALSKNEIRCNRDFGYAVFSFILTSCSRSHFTSSKCSSNISSISSAVGI